MNVLFLTERVVYVHSGWYTSPANSPRLLLSVPVGKVLLHFPSKVIPFSAPILLLSSPPHSPPPPRVLPSHPHPPFSLIPHCLQDNAATSAAKPRKVTVASNELSPKDASTAPVSRGHKGRSLAGKQAGKIAGSGDGGSLEKAARAVRSNNLTENKGLGSWEKGAVAVSAHRGTPEKAASAAGDSNLPESKGVGNKDKGKVGSSAPPEHGSASDALMLLTKGMPPRKKAEIKEFVSEAKQYYHGIDEEELEEED